MRPGLWITFIAVCSILCFTDVVAQPYSYIYIQGDKTTPFYVKMEGQMQPRYGKNHCIISDLAAGPLNIEILFQQNAFPAEKFTIEVPENRGMGFMLDKQADGFVLYDLQKKIYIKPVNEGTK
jgi:hypothetical protein